jgi:hypothetical protein
MIPPTLSKLLRLAVCTMNHLWFMHYSICALPTIGKGASWSNNYPRLLVVKNVQYVLGNVNDTKQAMGVYYNSIQHNYLDAKAGYMYLQAPY